MIFKHAFSIGLYSAVLALAVLLCVSGCTTDPEYSQKLAAARTDCTGKEIVGIWVSKSSVGMGVACYTTVLFRPDGTGRLRSKVTGQIPGKAVPLDVRSLTWRYVGNGSWQSQVEALPNAWGYIMDIRYTGENLVVEEKELTGSTAFQKMLFVRADSQTSVDDYLQKR